MDHTVLEYITKYLWAPIAAYIVWDQKKHREEVENLKTSVTKLEVTSVTDEQVRHVVKEEIAPLHHAIEKNAETTQSVSEGVNEIKLALARHDAWERSRAGTDKAGT